MDLSESILQTISDRTITFRQRFIKMAKIAEHVINPIRYSEKATTYLNDGIIYDMGEGLTPYRPRYCIPDFKHFMDNGSEFLDLEPPKDIWDAAGNLLCLYHNLTGGDAFPVFIGCLDTILTPFVTDKEEAKRVIEFLLKHVDRTISNAFCHANLGPEDTIAGRIILDVTEKMKTTCPNMSLLYRPDTPDEYALHAIRTGLQTSKPSFANDELYRKDHGDYAVVSCYNVFPIGSSGMTLTRLNMNRLPEIAGNPEKLLNEVLPQVVEAMCEIIDLRIQFIVDTCHYFENTFLSREGLIHFDDDHMIGMFGYVGLAECVNQLLHVTEKTRGYGNCEEADDLGEKIMEKIHTELSNHQPKYGKFALHAQVGVSEDIGISPGGRIPIGSEPDMPQHITHFARMHRYCSAGCGEIFPFDETAKRNPEAILSIIKGAFSVGARYVSFYSADSDLVRISGYLVKKSDIEKMRQGHFINEGATVLGKDVDDNQNLLDRKTRSVNA